MLFRSLYGCFSPRARCCPTPQPNVPTASEGEDISSVIQLMPELHELCAKPASLVVRPIGTSEVALPCTPAPLEPNQSLDFVDRGGLGVEVFHSPECFGQVVPMGDEVVACGALESVPGSLFAKNLCDFLVSLGVDDPWSGMTIGCLLKEREIKSKSKKVGSGTLKERSLRSKINKIGVSRKASAAAR